MPTALIKLSRLALPALCVLALCAAQSKPAAAQVPDLTLQNGLYYSATYNAYYGPDLLLNYAPNPGGTLIVTESSISETTYDDMPVSVTDQAYSTTVDALLNGQSIFSMTFALSATDPAFQAAVTQADNLLTADGASFSLPTLVASLATQSSATTDTITGQTTGTPTSTSVTTFGPGILGPGIEPSNGAFSTSVVPPNSQSSAPAYFHILAGQTDINLNKDTPTTIDRTVTTTNTDLLTQTYDIVGTTHAAPAVPEASDLALLALGLLPLGLIVRARRQA
jgi:hypothetical protein